MDDLLPGTVCISYALSIRDDSYGVMVANAMRAAVADNVCRADVLKVRSSTHLFRKAFVANLRRAGADADAVEQLVGHKLGGVKEHYLNLDDLMVAAVGLVPPIVDGGNVVPFPSRKNGRTSG